MNLITETRYGLVRYVVLWGLFAALYAVVFGIAATLPAGAAVLDGAVFWIVSGLEVLILWNVLRYGTVGAPTTNLFRIGMVSLVAVVGILFVAVAVGAEMAAVWLATGSMSKAFALTIPARCLTTAVVYVCFVLWYSSAVRSDEQTSETGEAVGATGEKPAQRELREVPAPLERITVKGFGGKIEVIDVSRIIYIQAEGDYVAIVTGDGRWLKEGTMKWFEESLPRDRFVRVHRSYIVSVSHISRIETSGRDHMLILRSGNGVGIHGGGSIRLSDTGYRLLKRNLGL